MEDGTIQDTERIRPPDTDRDESIMGPDRRAGRERQHDSQTGSQSHKNYRGSNEE